MDNSPNVNEAAAVWQNFFQEADWQQLIEGVIPKETTNGPIYVLPNFLQRAGEDLAIVDMRGISFSEPHYHPEPDIELYFVLQGSGLVVVGSQERKVRQGEVITIPPRRAHFAIPDKELVIGIVNIPPFDPERYLVVTESNPAVGFDKEQFERLATARQVAP